MFKKLKAVKEGLIPKYAMRIDEHEPICNETDFMRELKKYCEAEHRSLVVLKESMTPIVKIDGCTYIGRLDRFIGMFGGGAKLDEAYPTIHMGRDLGYKPIYLYPYEYIEK